MKVCMLVCRYIGCAITEHYGLVDNKILVEVYEKYNQEYCFTNLLLNILTYIICSFNFFLSFRDASRRDSNQSIVPLGLWL